LIGSVSSAASAVPVSADARRVVVVGGEVVVADRVAVAVGLAPGSVRSRWADVVAVVVAEPVF
jgi:hypothetical protein